MLARDSFEHIHERSNPYNRYRQAWGEDITILVEEPIPGDWEMISNTHPYEKLRANLIRFDVPAAKGKRDESKI
jgi:hypothetical protein